MCRLLLTLTLVLASCPPAFSSEYRTSVIVPAGTEIKMYIAGDVTSRSMRAGDSFEAQAATDVRVDGSIVVRKGAAGEGTVGGIKHTRGSVALDPPTLLFNWVYATDGTKLKLAQGDQVLARQAASSTETAPAILAKFGSAGFFAIVSAFSSENASVQTATADGK